MLFGKFTRAKINDYFYARSFSSIIYNKWYSPIKYTNGTKISISVPNATPPPSVPVLLTSFIATDVNTGIDTYWNVKIKMRMNLCSREDS
jgi:hypothetical protein